MTHLLVVSWLVLGSLAGRCLAQGVGLHLGGGFTHAGDARPQALAGVWFRFGSLVLRPEVRFADTRDHGPLVAAGGAIGLTPARGTAILRPYLLASFGYALAPEEGDESPLIGGALGVTIGRSPVFFAEARYEGLTAPRTSFYNVSGRRTLPGLLLGLRLGRS